MYVRSKQKLGCSSSITKRLTRSSPFDVRNYDVWDCWMSNFINLVMDTLGSMFHVRLFKAKNKVFQFNYQKMNMFESIQCSKIDVPVCSMFDIMVFNPALHDNTNAVQYLMEGSTAMECTQLSERTSESTLRTIFQCDRPSLHNFRVLESRLPWQKYLL